MTRTVSILGATGSVGQSCADVIVSAADQFDVKLVTAHSQAHELAALAIKLNADMAVIADEAHYGALKDALAGTSIKTAAGREDLIEAAGQDVDLTMAAIVGVAGLEPIMAAIAGSKAVAIANKEPLVSAGALVIEAARKAGTKILPVDSEHNAIFQVFEEQNRAQIERIILTASGGPFREWSLEQMASATPAQAVAHPNWTMGAKISVDSASMMNKALEVIEAHYLFAMPADKIDVLIHPQSVVHSMVEYADGSILAQMGASDMRTPIASAMAWPLRMHSPGERLDVQSLSRLDFLAPDTVRFPALARAFSCLKAGEGACIALNAANEIAVAAFLAEKIRFLDIIDVIDSVLESFSDGALNSIETVINLDEDCRRLAQGYIHSHTIKQAI